MFELPAIELIIFIFVILLYLTAAVLAVCQIRPGGRQHQTILTHFFALAVVAEAVILILRALAIKAFPLTGLFESMLVLTLVMGLLYLAFGIVIRQVWFGSVMSWLILLMIVLTAFVAHPAVEPQKIASEPWAVAHGLTMILGAAMVLLAVVTAYVYLLGSRRLKQKQIVKVIGMVPNIQKLQRINLSALKAAFVFFTFGLSSGIIGVLLRAEFLGKTSVLWLVDSKIIGITIVWIILGIVIVLHWLRLIKGKRIAYATVIMFVWIVFAFVGAHIFCDTKHKFSAQDAPDPTPARELNR